MTALVAVLAGGRGRRMGGAKPVAELGGEPLIARPVRAATAAGLAVVVVAKAATPLPPLDVPVWQEPDEPTHPLLGIVTALERADGRPVVVCGCDMPFVEPSFIAHLATRCDRLVVPSLGGRLHPLLARYEPVLLEPLRSALGSRKALQAIVAGLGPDLIDDRELGNPERLLFNVNTPADLDEAERLIDA